MYLIWRLLQRSAPQLDAQIHIVVDGSNVMYWGGEPSVQVLNRVLVALEERGLNPMVFFDANVGYKLWDRHANARHVAPKIGVAVDRVVIAPSGTTADELLLDFAIKNGLRVVSNDRFLDWRVQFPQILGKGFLVKGRWQQGSVMLQGVERG
ncbi:MAG: hypothetical protein V3V25_05005 [Paracoccaceae bacterium]